MNILFDASALIHLINGNLLDTVLNLPGKTWFIGPIVLDECKEDGLLPIELENAINDSRILVLSDDQISSSAYLHFIERFKLGEGETECLSFGKIDNFVVCCDDLKARQMMSGELGLDRLIGSLGLLREAVLIGQMTDKDAFTGYQRMIAAGGFLPVITLSYFR